MTAQHVSTPLPVHIPGIGTKTANLPSTFGVASQSRHYPHLQHVNSLQYFPTTPKLIVMRHLMKHGFAYLGLLLMVCASPTALAGLYKCIDAQGNVTYSQTPSEQGECKYH